jgi:hypothetical protein
MGNTIADVLEKIEFVADDNGAYQRTNIYVIMEYCYNPSTTEEHDLGYAEDCILIHNKYYPISEEGLEAALHECEIAYTQEQIMEMLEDPDCIVGVLEGNGVSTEQASCIPIDHITSAFLTQKDAKQFIKDNPYKMLAPYPEPMPLYGEDADTLMKALYRSKMLMDGEHV